MKKLKTKHERNHDLTTTDQYPGFSSHQLDDTYSIHQGTLPDDLAVDEARFEELWELHPAEFHEIVMQGKVMKTPRWQQAYNKDYLYSGSRNEALPVPEMFVPFWDWARETIDDQLNGLLLNWYDGASGHYIGRHRDSHEQLLEGSPIITISLGGERKFRMRPWRGSGFTDFPTADGTVIVLPYDTNLHWTHEVPKCGMSDRRISITLRAFREDSES